MIIKNYYIINIILIFYKIENNKNTLHKYKVLYKDL